MLFNILYLFIKEKGILKLFFFERLKIIMLWKGLKVLRLMGCVGWVVLREMLFDIVWRIWVFKVWRRNFFRYRIFLKFFFCDKKIWVWLWNIYLLILLDIFDK